MIRGLRFQNYRLMEDFVLGLTPEQLTDNDNPAVSPPLASLVAIIGHNASGKTSVFEGLAFLRDIMLLGPTDVSRDKARASIAEEFNWNHDPQQAMSFSLLFEQPPEQYYGYRLTLKRQGDGQLAVVGEEALSYHRRQAHWEAACLLRRHEQEPVLRGENEQPLPEPCAEGRMTALSYFGRSAESPQLHYIYRQLTGVYYYHLASNQEPATSLLEQVQKAHPQDFAGWLAAMVTAMRRGQSRKDSFDPQNLSTGERKFLEMLLLLKLDYSLVCYDEPDVSLYYMMMEELLKNFRDFSLEADRQIFFSTHNSKLLQGMKPAETWYLTRDDARGVLARSVGDNPIAVSMYEEGLDLGMLWYGGYLGEP